MALACGILSAGTPAWAVLERADMETLPRSEAEPLNAPALTAEVEPVSTGEDYPLLAGAKRRYKPLYFSFESVIPRTSSTGGDLALSNKVLDLGLRARLLAPLSVKSKTALAGVYTVTVGYPQLRAHDFGFEVWYNLGPGMGEGFSVSGGVGLSSREKRINNRLVDSLGEGFWTGATASFGIAMHERTSLLFSASLVSRKFWNQVTIRTLDLGVGLLF